jgi:hypothetical protein
MAARMRLCSGPKAMVLAIDKAMADSAFLQVFNMVSPG